MGTTIQIRAFNFEGVLPRWALMWAIAVVIFFLAKLLTYLPARKAPTPLLRRLAYFLAWPGLDAHAFLAPAKPPEVITVAEWTFAAAKLGVGAALLSIGAQLASAGAPYFAGWLGMLGVVFTLHFGLFHLLSCYWRSRGVSAPPLMNWPIRARSLAEFWGQRWNRAFRDLTHRYLFRPLVARCGPIAGLLLAFLFSGLIHELAITIPAGDGYGGPTLYFLLQAAGLWGERSPIGKSLGLASGKCGRFFALLVAAGPAGLLFPRAFVVGVVAPFLEALRSALESLL